VRAPTTTRAGVIPRHPGDLVWKAVQRYDDGEEASWFGPPDSDSPAAVTTVSAAAAPQNAGGEGERTARAGGLVLGAAALAVALRRRPRVVA
jgi:hypothetical protein